MATEAEITAFAEQINRQQAIIEPYARKLYSELFHWFRPQLNWTENYGPAINKDTPEKQTHSINLIWARAQAEYRGLTGMPTLSRQDYDGWQEAAIAAGYNAKEVRAMEIAELYEIVRVWAMAKRNPTQPPADDDNEPPAELLANASKQIQRMIGFLWNKPRRINEFKLHVWNGSEPSDEAYKKGLQRFRDYLIEQERFDINVCEKGSMISLEYSK